MSLIPFQNVTTRGELHDYTQCRRILIIKGLLVANDVLLIVGSQDTDLVQGIVSLLFFHRTDLDLSYKTSTFFRAYSLPSAFRFTLKT